MRQTNRGLLGLNRWGIPENLCKGKYLFCLVGSFIFVNWLLLTAVEKLANPDFYTYFKSVKFLFSGNLRIGQIPPLFPLLLGGLGQLVKLFGGEGDPFILAGRIISLISGIGIAYFTYLLLKRYMASIALLWVLLLICTPFFLKSLVTAQTDMLYLFFTTATFYVFQSARFKWSAFGFVFGALMTRFEGVLLVGSAYINFFNRKKRTWFLATASIIPAIGLLYLFFAKFANRLLHKIHFIISNQSYLLFLKQPSQLTALCYENILFFLSPKLPGLLKLIMLGLLISAFFFGFIYLFRLRWQFASALLFYFIVFILSKGYVHKIHPAAGFRRFLSPLWIIFFVSALGVHYIIKKLRKFDFISNLIIYLGYACLLIFTLYMIRMKGNTLIFLPLFLVIVLYSGIKLNLRKSQLLLFVFILTFFIGQSYYKSAKISNRSIISGPNKAGYVIAQWINAKQPEGNLLVYSNWNMIDYYLKSPRKRFRFVFKDKKLGENSDKLISILKKKIQRRRIKYVLFDNYKNIVDRPWEATIKRWLYQQSKSRTYFRVKKILFYRGRPVAFILEPKYNKFLQSRLD